MREKKAFEIDFLEELREYLLKRYNKEEVVKERGACEFSIELYDTKWIISGTGTYPCVEGDEEGNITVRSPTAGEVPDIIFLSCELDKVRITSDEINEIWEMIPNRYNWEKLEKKYRKLVKWLRKADRLAEKAMRKTGVKTVFFIPNPKKEEGDRFYFIAKFNSKRMDDKEKIKTIEKALNILEDIIKEV